MANNPPTHEATIECESDTKLFQNFGFHTYDDQTVIDEKYDGSYKIVKNMPEPQPTTEFEVTETYKVIAPFKAGGGSRQLSSDFHHRTSNDRSRNQH